MGQKNTRTAVVYAAPDLSYSYGGDLPMLKKAGSLSTIGTRNTLTGKREKSSSLRRTRSFTDQQDQEEILRKQMQLRKRVEKEAQELEDWVRQRPTVEREPSKLQDLAGLSVANTLKTTIDIERLPCERDIKEHVEFLQAPVFDETMADPSVSFSNSGRTIIYNGKGYSTTVLKTPKNHGLTTGRCGWILYIERSRIQGWIQIGVVDQTRWKARCKTLWDGNPHPFRLGEVARRNNGNFHSGRNMSEASIIHESIYVGGYTTGDTISVRVDFDEQEITWMKNGEPYGTPVAFPGGPLWPSVSLDSPGEAVSLLYYTCSMRSSHCNVHHNKVHTGPLENGGTNSTGQLTDNNNSTKTNFTNV